MSNTFPQTNKIGFIGTGIMGSAMAGHLLKAGYQLVVSNRSQEKAQALLQSGAVWKESPKEVAQEVDVLFSIVGFPEDVRAIYLGEQGIIQHIKEHAVVCDMTTSEPSLAIEIAQLAQRRNVISLDAPVSGGDTGARNATLSIMVGGAKEGFETILPLLQIMGKSINYMGQAGAGQHTKMCNQTVIAGTMMGMIEALRYAQNANLDLQNLLNAIGKGAAGSWSLDNLAPRIVKNDFDPGFLIKHFIKDMAIAQQEADSMQVNTPVLDTALGLYRKAQNAGGENLGTQGLYKLWRDNPEW